MKTTCGANLLVLATPMCHHSSSSNFIKVFKSCQILTRASLTHSSVAELVELARKEDELQAQTQSEVRHEHAQSSERGSLQQDQSRPQRLPQQPTRPISQQRVEQTRPILKQPSSHPKPSTTRAPSSQPHFNPRLSGGGVPAKPGGKPTQPVSSILMVR
jgi:hypothetical protein